MKMFRKHWKNLIVLILFTVLIVYFAYSLWPRPMAELIPENPVTVSVMTSKIDFNKPNPDMPGSPTFVFKPYLYDTEAEIALLLDALDSYTYHYPLHRFIQPVLSGIFAYEYELDSCNDPSLPDSISLHITSQSNDPVLLSSEGGNNLQLENDEYLRIDYLGDKKGYQLYQDIVNCLSDEYLSYDSTLQN